MRLSFFALEVAVSVSLEGTAQATTGAISPRTWQADASDDPAQLCVSVQTKSSIHRRFSPTGYCHCLCQHMKKIVSICMFWRISSCTRWLSQLPWRRASSSGFSQRTCGWPSIQDLLLGSGRSPGPSQAGPRLPRPQVVVVRMNQVRETQKAQAAGQGWWRKEPSPFALRTGYKQNLDALHTNAIS